MGAISIVSALHFVWVRVRHSGIGGHNGLKTTAVDIILLSNTITYIIGIITSEREQFCIVTVTINDNQNFRTRST